MRMGVPQHDISRRDRSRLKWCWAEEFPENHSLPSGTFLVPICKQSWIMVCVCAHIRHGSRLGVDTALGLRWGSFQCAGTRLWGTSRHLFHYCGQWLANSCVCAEKAGLEMGMPVGLKMGREERDRREGQRSETF